MHIRNPLVNEKEFKALMRGSELTQEETVMLRAYFRLPVSPKAKNFHPVIEERARKGAWRKLKIAIKKQALIFIRPTVR